jgi:RNA polymerase sigma factor (sigma-70 family)
MTASLENHSQELTPATENTTGKAFSSTLADAVRRHLGGDPSAITEIVLLVRPWLFRLARGYRLPAHSADDVVQNTLLAFWQHVDRLRDPQTTVAWLSVVARNEAFRTMRLEGRAIPVGEAWELDRCSEIGNPEQALLLEHTRRAVHRNLAKLPDRGRDLLELAFLADVHDYATISAVLDMPVGSIGPTRKRGLEKMRTLLEADQGWAA